MARSVLSDVNPEHYLWLRDGTIAKNLDELYQAISRISDDVFSHHANGEKNDFFSWIDGVYHDKHFAAQFLRARTKEKAAKMLKKKIESYRKSPGINPEEHLWLTDGTIIRSLDELKKAISGVGEDVLRHHITGERNDFYNWVKDVLHDKSLAEKLLDARTKDEIAEAISGKPEEKKKDIVKEEIRPKKAGSIKKIKKEIKALKAEKRKSSIKPGKIASETQETEVLYPGMKNKGTGLTIKEKPKKKNIKLKKVIKAEPAKKEARQEIKKSNKIKPEDKAPQASKAEAGKKEKYYSFTPNAMNSEAEKEGAMSREEKIKAQDQERLFTWKATVIALCILIIVISLLKIIDYTVTGASIANADLEAPPFYGLFIIFSFATLAIVYLIKKNEKEKGKKRKRKRGEKKCQKK